MRAMFNRDISTGLIPVFDEFTTFGPSSTFHVKNKVPDNPEPKCYILAPGTCTPEQYATVKDGSAIIKDFFVVGNVKDGVSGEIVEEGKQHIMSDEEWPEL